MTPQLTGRRAAAGLLAALLLLSLAWLAGGNSRGHVPVYDGVNAPDDNSIVQGTKAHGLFLWNDARDVAHALLALYRLEC